MRSKDGESVCKNCGGTGCYQCGRTGKIVQCPNCANDSPELISKQGDLYHCQICNSVFTKSGRVKMFAKGNHS